jgi:hypothetical protein
MNLIVKNEKVIALHTQCYTQLVFIKIFSIYLIIAAFVPLQNWAIILSCVIIILSISLYIWYMWSIR